MQPGIYWSYMCEICPCGHMKPSILEVHFLSNFHACVNGMYQALFSPPIEPVIGDYHARIIDYALIQKCICVCMCLFLCVYVCVFYVVDYSGGIMDMM